MAHGNTSLPPLFPSFALKLWGGLTSISAPFLRIFLAYRIRKKKELANCVSQREGKTLIARPQGMLIWFHAASVGETRSILPVIDAICTQAPSITILVTCATVSAYRLLEKQPLPIIYQFSPWDVPEWCRSFLEHWRPQMVIFIESELWPTMLSQCALRNIPLYLLNGRISEKSTKRWLLCPSIASFLINHFKEISSCSPQDERRFLQLGYKGRRTVCNLKAYDHPLSPQVAEQAKEIKKRLNGRPIFLALSLHRCELPHIVQAVRLARQKIPDLLTLIAPRHPSLFESVNAQGITCTKTIEPDWMASQRDIVIINKLGDTDLLLALCDCVFIGNSIVKDPGGGHNPFEAAYLKRAIVTGPFVWNFKIVFEVFSPLIPVVKNSSELAQWLLDTLKDPKERQELANLIFDKAQKLSISPTHIASQIIGRLSCS